MDCKKNVLHKPFTTVNEINQSYKVPDLGNGDIQKILCQNFHIERGFFKNGGYN